MTRYWTSTCKTCTLRVQCTTGPERRISRWEHEAVWKTFRIGSTTTPMQWVSAVRQRSIRSAQ
ncbi:MULTISPECIES: hypothetical protein [Bradyrhizobium]|uniref:hypothetical protein n=1 Tax=Bradyrhizobium TaxID=374 RepID=UPI0035BFF3FA